MQNVSVRIERILIENLKNVEHGEIALSNSRRPDGASMLGIFGQNGSGKSTLVDALEMTKTSVMGRRLPHRWANLVNVDAEYGSVECEFSITRPEDDEICTAVYTFKIRSEEDVSSEADGDEDADESSEQRMEVFEDEPRGHLVRIFDETLKVRIEGPKRRMRPTTLIDTTRDAPFGNSAKRKALVGDDADGAIELAVEMRLAHRESRSFVFSQALHKAIREKWVADGKEPETIAQTTLMAISHLKRFCQICFFVLNTRDSGMPALRQLPYPFRYGTEKGQIVGITMLPMEGTSVIPKRFSTPSHQRWILPTSCCRSCFQE